MNLFDSEEKKLWKGDNPFHIILFLLPIIILYFSGLSIRSLWGPEGRWAEIVREMMLTGNYFLPTINGRVYFDKPLLSYWLIIPFSSLFGEVTEFSLRLPSVILGILSVFITYAIGKQLFGKKASVISALMLSTSFMFIFWSRTASAEMLNLFMIWFALFLYIRTDIPNKTTHAIAFYLLLSVSAFCKGLVAPSLVLFSLLFTNMLELVLCAKKQGIPHKPFLKCFYGEVRWFFSATAMKGMSVGLIVFSLLLLMPVIFSGSWDSVKLMWKENVLRFFSPFDHIEPFYVYLKYIPVYLVPWAFAFTASLFDVKSWIHNKKQRWILMVALSMFIFFIFSGSRRSYYILPLIPALSIITGAGLNRWLQNGTFSKKDPFFWAYILTSGMLWLSGAFLIYAYFNGLIPKNPFFFLLGFSTVAALSFALILFFKKECARGVVWLFLIVFSLELWAYTAGIGELETKRTLIPFINKASVILKNVKDEEISIYHTSNSALIFYLRRNKINTLDTIEDLKRCINENKCRYVITNTKIQTILSNEKGMKKFNTLLVEKERVHRREDPFALLFFP